MNTSLYDRMGGRPGLDLLLKHFYADVRQHHLIGPIFNARIQNWPVHLAEIASFWARITGGPAEYSGQMPMKHMSLGLDARHFATWLELWQFNCLIYLGAEEAREMIALAHDIARRLKRIVGVPPSDAPAFS